MSCNPQTLDRFVPTDDAKLVETATITEGDLKVMLRDNSQSPKVLSGVDSLFNQKDAPNFDAFDPDIQGASAGLNFEHIISGQSKTAGTPAAVLTMNCLLVVVNMTVLQRMLAGNEAGAGQVATSHPGARANDVELSTDDPVCRNLSLAACPETEMSV